MLKCVKCGKDIEFFDSYPSDILSDPNKRICKDCINKIRSDMKLEQTTSPIYSFKKRPGGVTGMVYLLVFSGIYKIIDVILALWISSMFSFIFTPTQVFALFTYGVFYFLLYIIIAYKLFKGVQWAWASLVIILILGIIANFAMIIYLSIFGDTELFTEFSVGRILPIIIWIIVLIYFTKAEVRSYFGLDKPGAITSAIKNKMTIVISIVSVISLMSSTWLLSLFSY